MTELDTRVISLDEGIRKAQDAVDEAKERAEEIQRYKTDEDGEETNELTAEAQRLQSEFVDSGSRRDSLQELKRQWGEVSWTITEMSYGEIMRARDEVQRASQAAGQDDPGSGSLQVWTLRLGIEDAPEEAPNDPANYPLYLGEWLYEEVNDFNTTEGVDVGNLWGEE